MSVLDIIPKVDGTIENPFLLRSIPNINQDSVRQGIDAILFRNNALISEKIFSITKQLSDTYSTTSQAKEFLDIVFELNDDKFPLLKEQCLPESISIDIIEDSDTYVKMTVAERHFLNNLDEKSFKLQIKNNSFLKEPVQFISGRSLNITQMPGDNIEGPLKVKFDTNIPLEYYHISKYNIEAYRPDPDDLYRYKVYDGQYEMGSLRVYVNTHRIPDSSINQFFYSIGEFRFNKNIPISELPDKNDKVICDFDIPLFFGPDFNQESEKSEYGYWWGDIISASDYSILKINKAAKPLRFYPLIGSSSTGIFKMENSFRIRNSNPYSDTEIGIDTLYFILDISSIDHNMLKNYESSRHHVFGSDNQNIWNRIVGTSGFITPSSQTTELKFKSSNGSMDIICGNSNEIDLLVNSTIDWNNVRIGGVEIDNTIIGSNASADAYFNTIYLNSSLISSPKITMKNVGSNCFDIFGKSDSDYFITRFYNINSTGVKTEWFSVISNDYSVYSLFSLECFWDETEGSSMKINVRENNIFENFNVIKFDSNIDRFAFGTNDSISRSEFSNKGKLQIYSNNNEQVEVLYLNQTNSGSPIIRIDGTEGNDTTNSIINQIHSDDIDLVGYFKIKINNKSGYFIPIYGFNND